MQCDVYWFKEKLVIVQLNKVS